MWYSRRLRVIGRIKFWSLIVFFRFLMLDLQWSPSCTTDYVEVFDGLSLTSTSLGKFCGSQLPQTVNATGSSMIVKFVTDSSISSSGFIANYFQSMLTVEGRYCFTCVTFEFGLSRHFGISLFNILSYFVSLRITDDRGFNTWNEHIVYTVN